MPIAVSEEHEGLRHTVRRWLDTYCPPAVPRATLDAAVPELPTIWKQLADQGWLGLHIAEELGGQGFSLAEVSVVLDEFGYSMVPGPVLPTLLVAAAVQIGADDAQAVMAGLLDGTTPGALSYAPNALDVVESHSDGSLVVSGSLRPVLGGMTGSLLLAPASGGTWCLVDIGEDTPGVAREPINAVDSTRDLGAVHLERAFVPANRRLTIEPERLQELALVLSSAEAAGGMRWCLDTASEYAKVRVQFGRPIGQFQAIKHKLADMLVRSEQSSAASWDAARAFASEDAGADERELGAVVAGSLTLDGFVDSAKDCIQILGGIGFTWEHDAHLYLKRATATRALLGSTTPLHDRIVDLAEQGVRRSLAEDLPPEAAAIRNEVAPLIARAHELEGFEQRRYLAEHALLVPHWPAPFGRAATPLEQLVIDEECASVGVLRPNLGVGAWALPTIVGHGTAEQQDRWVWPTLFGELSWCQLFSEPGAGSDLASLSTRATRRDGGWVLNGQKVWTSLAHTADWGICLARSDPDAPKHAGITYFIVDMKTPGIDVRPLRELTGMAMFNEVFLNEVFVPDDCVVGSPGEGWKIGRTTLANERVSMSSGAAFGVGVEAVLGRLGRLGPGAPAGAGTRMGFLLAEAQSLRLMAHRIMLRSLSGMDPGSGASVRKLLGAEHEQRVQEFGLSLYGAEGATMEGSAQRWAHGFLVTRCLTIAGGTSEVQRNVIAERLLGQPRDPEA